MGCVAFGSSVMLLGFVVMLLTTVVAGGVGVGGRGVVVGGGEVKLTRMGPGSGLSCRNCGV